MKHLIKKINQYRKNMSNSAKRQKEFPDRPKKPQIAPVIGPTVEPAKPDYPNDPKPMEHPELDRKPEINPETPCEFDAGTPNTVIE